MHHILARLVLFASFLIFMLIMPSRIQVKTTWVSITPTIRQNLNITIKSADGNTYMAKSILRFHEVVYFSD